MKRVTYTPFHQPVIVLFQCPAAVSRAARERRPSLYQILKNLIIPTK
jgi:hypothetical protein